MPLITFISHDGASIEVEAQTGASLMQVAVANGVTGIIGECGGVCSCATCHCYMDAPWAEKVDGPDNQERNMLDCVLDPEPVSRLSCQVKVSDALDGAVIRLPASQY
ncbi:2Fe-2S iron-sulfur cluster-binding protein [Paraburkholderia sp. J67]|uniref:2Fe-2S iron-sulfur cluster-binding protein n=1 Tax=Paraburkholderia sp. J67 TaxID=2805435 RepID=UPI002ABE2095|nr:2Fe-2S iron-sulfur cluster-binding protein [Paraburkholderia sp. J67]